jgi:protoheme IX farnesyltransferase
MTELVAGGTTRAPSIGRLKDLAALGKPRLSLLVIFTTAVGVWFARAPLGPITTLIFLFATSALVASANTMNCWVEKEIDGLMTRTCDRPLPAGRLEPRTALILGIILVVVSLTLIGWTTNALTTSLGAIAFLTYVLVYTPLKRVTPWAVLVGAVPGALPPLMGWTAATNELGGPGLFLFGILFLWQLPHFLAISLYLEDDFRRGGIRVLPVVRGRRVAWAHLLLYVACLFVFSLAAWPLRLAGPLYATVAAVMGLCWLLLAAAGLRGRASDAWARAIFGFSLLYLPLLMTVLVLDSA